MTNRKYVLGLGSGKRVSPYSGVHGNVWVSVKFSFFSFSETLWESDSAEIQEIFFIIM
jgi:hypothetical protein